MSYRDLISKTDFLNWTVCPDSMWVSKNRPLIFESFMDGDLEEIVSEKNRLVRLARQLFPAGEENIYVPGGDGFSKMQEETERRISNGANVLYGITAIDELNRSKATAEILVLNATSGKWDLYGINGVNNPQEKHYLGLAFQTKVFKNAGWKIGETFLIHLNKTYVRSGPVDPHQLFKIENISEKVLQRGLAIDGEINSAYSKSQSEILPTRCNCLTKPANARCKTFPYFYGTRTLDAQTHEFGYILPEIFNLSPSGKRGQAYTFHKDLLDLGILKIKDIPDSLIPHTQKATVAWINVAKETTERIIQRDQIKEVLKTYTYPLYFLDYETLATEAIPMFDGTNSFHKTVFQYSLHIALSESDLLNGKIIHREYLHTENTLPGPALVSQLAEDIGPQGSVIVWNKSFEMARNRELAEMLPGRSDFLLDLNNRIVDLMEIFSKYLWIDHDFKTSSSIKKVLPVLCPDLDYHNLAICNGTDASSLWPKAMLGTLRGEWTREKVLSDLIEYCGMDTYAMVRILQEVLKEIGPLNPV